MTSLREDTRQKASNRWMPAKDAAQSKQTTSAPFIANGADVTYCLQSIANGLSALRADAPALLEARTAPGAISDYRFIYGTASRNDNAG